ncbi:aquaporin family protein [Buchnera aphidicola (Aphis craccivore)]|uniref:Aquaporin family protein n=1 Tax=Buchnera aphidicola (Aphis craccivora) TaxID=466616 RepID=A0AA95E4G4_9GAMM|nr:MIP/aquaporin family protein [Buchnera aphidicola]QLL40686.1 aquaporin family protein [Buchnera aphidicola (Aphis craccivore)]WAI17524.1 MAG: aquaporin family protein [Buchnera aphidicola (Aphis craccivora)]
MNICSKKNILQQCIAEFLGTGLIIFFGVGCLAASKLTNFHFNKYEMSIIWGFSVALSIYLSISISGAHLNPAITIFFWLFYKFNKKKVIPYIISQISGAFFFTILIYYIYHNLLISFEHKYNITRGTKESLQLASIFCVYPQKNYILIRNFILEIIISIFFIIALMIINDKKNFFVIQKKFNPCLIGILVAIINISLGSLNNIILNPAHDLGPRIFLSLIGWGKIAFTGVNNSYFSYFLTSIIAPISGINLGGWIYKKFINN